MADNWKLEYEARKERERLKIAAELIEFSTVIGPQKAAVLDKIATEMIELDLDIGSCGCCGSPWIISTTDTELVVDDFSFKAWFEARKETGV